MQDGTKKRAAEARKARLAGELRQNLKRRKSQTRKRKVTPDAAEPGDVEADTQGAKQAPETE